jgi:fluoride exporter
MNALTSSLLIALGAAIGGNARFWFGQWWTGRAQSEWPWHTLIVNVIGSMLLGAFIAAAILKGWGTGWRMFVAVGFAGGFTTFSTFSAEMVEHIEKGRIGQAASYALASVVLSVGACFLAAHFTRVLLQRA